ncbi:MAG: sigma-70 family RNA polymerase sigma factor [Anaerolineae bacterium]|nr:sigma-70 family RNA polymerase sigma factor [Anaerolineae bacterium]NIN95495.1 sigma-70 family RNA polymerase sigma factor [Anaerolineae bacterium]NIQ78479.1 sigma-70 family RNA polymerase sigma factor [Anaerolineae bacterium]
MSDNEAQLVVKAQRGDEDAFEQLVRAHQRYVFNLAYRVLGDYREAEDVAQETFVRAWRGLPSFRAESRFTTWLYRIARNVCLNRLPRLQAELTQTELLGETPADVFNAKERRAFVHAELARLPEKYRLVLTLRYLQDLSYAEIADVLNLPLGTVKTHLHRGREALAARLAAWEAETTSEHVQTGEG